LAASLTPPAVDHVDDGAYIGVDVILERGRVYRNDLLDGLNAAALDIFSCD
jgi:hypothetical protein